MCNDTYNMRVVQGDIMGATFTFTDKVTGDPIDLSIYTAIKMQIRKKPGTPVIAEGSMVDGNFAISGVGLNVVTMTGIAIPSETLVGSYLYDIEFSNATTEIKKTLISGTIIITPQITV